MRDGIISTRLAAIGLVFACGLTSSRTYAENAGQHFHNPSLLADRRLLQSLEIHSHLAGVANSEIVAQRENVGDLVRRIGGSTHVSMAVQASLQEEVVATTIQRINAADLMDVIAISIGATWRSDGSRWILTDVPDAAQLVTQNPFSLILETPSAVALNAFTPEQIQILKNGGRVNPAGMTPLQRKAFAARALETYMAYPDGRRKISIEALRAENVFYAQSHNDPGLPQEIGIYFPRTDGLDPEPQGRIPYENLRLADQQRLANIKIPALIPQPLPEATWKPAARNSDEERHFATDTRLDAVFKPALARKELAVWEVLGTASASSGVGLIAASVLGSRKLTSDLSHVSVREVLRSVEERTGGRWRPVRDIYVLQQDPRVERAAHTVKNLRDRRLRSSLEAFQTRLSLTSRKALDEDGTLSPTRLTQTERTALIDAMVVAFATRDNVAARVMELKDVTLKLLPADKARELPRRIRYDLPVTGGPAEAMEISWR